MIDCGANNKGDVCDTATAGRDGNAVARLDSGLEAEAAQLSRDFRGDVGDRRRSKLLTNAENTRVVRHAKSIPAER